MGGQLHCTDSYRAKASYKNRSNERTRAVTPWSSLTNLTPEVEEQASTPMAQSCDSLPPATTSNTGTLVHTHIRHRDPRTNSPSLRTTHSAGQVRGYSTISTNTHTNISQGIRTTLGARVSRLVGLRAAAGY
jgi:hypothetical protein